MGVCFLCDTKLYGERTRLCSSITPHSKTPYPQKIAELMGDEVVVIVTPADHMCKNCTSLLSHMDKLENDLELVKNAMLSYIQKKYGILPPDQIVKDVVIVNGHIKVEEQLEKDESKVPSGPTVGVSPTVTTATAQPPLKLLKTQQQQQQQHQLQQQQQQQSPTKQEITNKMKMYKCCFCTLQSNDLGYVRFHLRTHKKKKEPENPILNQAAAKALTPEREMKDFSPVIIKVMKPKPSNTQENKVESPMDVDKDQHDNNKGTVDTDMMLNDNVHTKGSTNVEQEEETENAGEREETENSQADKNVKEFKLKIKAEPVQEEAVEEDDEEDTVMFEQDEADHETPDSVEKEVDEDNANGRLGHRINVSRNQ